MINRKQSTVAWYVENNKASQVNPKVVDALLEKIKSFFGELMVARTGYESQYSEQKVKN